MAENWIAGAIKRPGAFSAKAAKAGKSTSAYASEKASAPGTLGRQARLAQTLMGMNRHATGAVVSPTPQATTQPQLGAYGQSRTQTTPNLYRPGGPINLSTNPPAQVGGGQPPQGPSPTVLNTVQGQRQQVRKPVFGQYPLR